MPRFAHGSVPFRKGSQQGSATCKAPESLCRLLTLPLELLQMILETAVHRMDMKEVYQLRSVSRLFNREIFRASVSTRLLERKYSFPGPTKSQAAKYIMQRVFTSPSTRTGLIGRIAAIIEFLHANQMFSTEALYDQVHEILIRSMSYGISPGRRIEQLSDESPFEDGEVDGDLLSASVLLGLPLPPIPVHLHYMEGYDVKAMLDTPLVYAARIGDLKLVRTFLDAKRRQSNGRDMSSCWSHGGETNHSTGPQEDLTRAFFEAARGGHEEIVRALIADEHGSPREGFKYRNLLRIAVQSGHIPIFRMLRDHGGNNFGSRLHSFILDEATRSGQMAIAEMALQDGARIVQNRKPNLHAITTAALLGRADFIKLFMSYGADLAENIGYTKTALQAALYAAATNGHAEIVRLLTAEAVEHGIYWNYMYVWSGAASAGHVHVIEVLLSRGPEVDDSLFAGPQKRECESPVMAASVNGHVNILWLFTKLGMDVAGRHREIAEAAFWAAAGKGHSAVLLFFVAQGLRTNLALYKDNPIMWPSVQKHETVMLTLKALGVDLGETEVERLK